MISYHLKKFSSAEERDQLLCDMMIDDLLLAMQKRGKASLVVSGGRTPKRLFQLLSQQTIPWSQVMITLADDRWVATDHEFSNERLVHENLLQNYAAKAQFVGLKNHDDSPFTAEKFSHKEIEDRMSLPFDLLVLGMGLDGHTASLFPCAAQFQEVIEEDKLMCRGITPLTSPYARMTLTLRALKNSRRIFLQIAGVEKLRTFLQIAADTSTKSPIRYLLDRENPLQVFWSN